MKKTKLIAILFAAGIMLSASKTVAKAAPRFTWTPTNGSYSVGQTFSVELAVDSDTEKTVAMDVVGTFDKAIVELSSIEKIAAPTGGFDFNWDATTPKISNVAGTFSATLSPTASSVLEGVIAKQPVLRFNFRALTTGTANVNLTCTQGSVNDTNILNPSSVDVVTCSMNQSGIYSIIAAAATTTTPTPTTLTPTATVAATATSTTLPQTGSVGATIGLVVFGAVCVLGALFLGLL